MNIVQTPNQTSKELLKMSLEEALNENTLALRALSAQLAGMNSITAAVGEEGGEAAAGKKRGRPARAAADTPPTAAAGTEAVPLKTVAAGSGVELHQGDTPRYFINDAKNVSYRVLKGEPLVAMPGATEVDEATYTAAKARHEAALNATIAANTVKSAPAPAPVEDDPFGESPAPAAVELTYEGLVERLRALRTTKGVPAVMDALKVVGLTSVPSLAARKDLFAGVAAALTAEGV